jgi:hypothetical protein
VSGAGDEFSWYQLAPGWQTAVEPERLHLTTFDGELQLLGYDWLSTCTEPGLCELVSYWRVVALAGGERRLFFHALDGNGDLLAQHDGLGAPAVHWQPGDLIVQWHGIWLETAVPITFRLGVYDPTTCVPGPCQNLLTETGDPYAAVTLPNLTNYINE